MREQKHNAQIFARNKKHRLLFYFSLLFSFFFEKDKFTEEYPELIAKRFTTKLGERVVRMLQAIFPSIPNVQARQTVTFHNQRDYIFVRRHRYEFKSREDVGIREVGPRFTLRLKSLNLGIMFN